MAERVWDGTLPLAAVPPYTLQRMHVDFCTQSGVVVCVLQVWLSGMAG